MAKVEAIVAIKNTLSLVQCIRLYVGYYFTQMPLGGFAFQGAKVRIKFSCYL